MDHHFGGDIEREDPSLTSGTSLAVRQFAAFAFGWAAVHSPSQPWRVERLIEREEYCLGCFGVRKHDVLVGSLVSSGKRLISLCRCCGFESMEVIDE